MEDLARHFRCKIYRLSDAQQKWRYCHYCKNPLLYSSNICPNCGKDNFGKGQPTISFSLYFSQGSGHTADPTLADVLNSLASDASGYKNARDLKTTQGTGHDKRTADYLQFDNWAAEFGYDTDSRKAEKIFRSVKRQSEQLKRTIGTEAYEELLWNTRNAYSLQLKAATSRRRNENAKKYGIHDLRKGFDCGRCWPR